MNILSMGVRLSTRGFLIIMIPYFPLFAWYYIFSHYILKSIVDGYTSTFFILNASFNFLVSFTVILTSLVISRINRTSVIRKWSILSSIGAIFIALVPTNTFRLAMYLFLGVIFGVTLLAYFVFFGDLTMPEERGRVAGLVGSIFLPVFSLVLIVVENLDVHFTLLLCIIINLGILAAIPLHPKRTTMLTAVRNPREIHHDVRTVLFYLIPWVIFSLINATLAKTVSSNISQYFSPFSLILSVTLQVVGGGLGALIGGAIADFFGRRLSLAFVLTLYGISSAISGLTTIPEVLYLLSLCNGLSWGALMTLYLFVIWGDLTDRETYARRYSIGLATFFSAMGVGALFTHLLLQVPLIAASITSCLLIFLSNVPLILAPELLPSDFYEKFRLALYIYLVKRYKLRSSANHM